MPRGSRPGERRGGRQRGTPNKSTLLKNAVFCAAAFRAQSITPGSYVGIDARSASANRCVRQRSGLDPSVDGPPRSYRRANPSLKNDRGAQRQAAAAEKWSQAVSESQRQQTATQSVAAQQSAAAAGWANAAAANQANVQAQVRSTMPQQVQMSTTCMHSGNMTFCN